MTTLFVNLATCKASGSGKYIYQNVPKHYKLNSLAILKKSKMQKKLHTYLVSLVIISFSFKCGLSECRAVNAVK